MPARAPRSASPAPPARSPCCAANSSASLDEVRAVALPVLRHRVIPNYNATGEGITTDQIITKLITTI